MHVSMCLLVSPTVVRLLQVHHALPHTSSVSSLYASYMFVPHKFRQEMPKRLCLVMHMVLIQQTAGQGRSQTAVPQHSSTKED